MVKEAVHVTLDEFAKDLEGFVERIAQDRETVVVESETGAQVEVRPARTRRRSPRLRGPRSAEDLEAFLSAAGSWSDVDDEDLLSKIYESRNLPPRPPVEL